MSVYRWLGLPVCLLWLIKVTLAQDYCLARDNNPYLFFASKTAYEFVYEKRITHQSISGCRPVQIWMLGKYGTSYPSWERLKAMSDMTALRDQVINNHESRRNGELCHMDREALKEWTWRIPLDMADRLSDQGHQDMIFLAKRLKTNFPSILDPNYSPDRFTFKFSDKEVTRSSAQAFAQELFGRTSPVYFTESNISPDLSVENCTTMQDPEITSRVHFEMEKFRQTPIASSIVNSVSRRLGFLYNLTFDTVLDIYDACRYEKAWNYSRTSPWCASFTRRDLVALEYFEDMKHFYQNGYGNDLALKYGCPLVKDLMENFERLANEEAGVDSGIFYFGNEVLVESVMARLGMANDKRQLPASINSLSPVEKRHWRTAFISPYAGNIAAIFYKCSSGEENKLMFYINEHMVEYEGCQVGLCSWEYIKDRFGPIISRSCNYDFCTNLHDSANPLSISTFTIFLTTALVNLLLFI